MPDELWMEVRDIVQETGNKTIPMEKKCKKAKWLRASVVAAHGLGSPDSPALEHRLSSCGVQT